MCARLSSHNRSYEQSRRTAKMYTSTSKNTSWVAYVKPPPFSHTKFTNHIQASIDAVGIPLTDDALAAAKAADAVLLGAIGGPEWGTGTVRPEQGILKLRKEMVTFGNLRPCFFASESLVDVSPLKAEICRGVNFTIVRELTGGIYFGERKEDDGDEISRVSGAGGGSTITGLESRQSERDGNIAPLA